jgi:hypothetical protein
MKKLFIILTAIAMVGAFTATAMAADWSFYGSARIATFWGTEADNPATDEEMDMVWAQQGNSRIGARVAVNENIAGRFEIGINDADIGERLLYGTWKMSWAQLLVGQAYAPGNIFISNQVYGGDANMLNNGGLYTGRQEMLRLAWSGGWGSLQVAGINPKDATADWLGTANVDTTIPKLEGAYTFSHDNFWIQASLGYQTYKVQNAADEDKDINANIYGVGGGVNFGGFYVNGVVWGGTNAKAYGLWTNTAAIPVPDAGGDVSDSTSIGTQIVLGFTFNDAFKVEGGVGQITTANDEYDKDDQAMVYYIQFPITMAPGITVTPEFGLDDQMKDKDDVDEGNVTYFGAKWQINF